MQLAMRPSKQLIGLVIFFVAVCSGFTGDKNIAVASKSNLVGYQESDFPESGFDLDDDWLEAHESNGPEGPKGVPMHPMSFFQAGLVLSVFLTGGGLAMLAKSK